MPRIPLRKPGAFDGSYRPPGTFRLVLTVCGGAQVMGTPFFMGPRAKQ
jgi:hypothetical protein